MRSIVVVACVLTGCEFGASDTAPTMQTGEVEAALLATHHRMHVRFESAKQIEQAILWGQLDNAHDEAKVLAELDEPGVLATWQPYLDDVQATAREIRRATDLGAAARAVGTLGQHCAACHVALSAEVVLPVEPPPTVDLRVGATMPAHEWAARQMWEGLIGPSDERWLRGASALESVPLNLVAKAVTPISPNDIDDVARIRLYAKRAATTSASDRGALFGTMLATCAHCHALLRDR
jgi:mono/diheme cytochrome c family protein